MLVKIWSLQASFSFWSYLVYKKYDGYFKMNSSTPKLFDPVLINLSNFLSLIAIETSFLIDLVSRGVLKEVYSKKLQQIEILRLKIFLEKAPFLSIASKLLKLSTDDTNFWPVFFFSIFEKLSLKSLILLINWLLLEGMENPK